MSIFLGEVIYQDPLYTSTQWQGRLFLYFTKSIDPSKGEGTKCGEIIGGVGVFLKKYKGDHKKWIEAVRKREKSTIESYLRQAEELTSKANWMIKNNDFKEE